MKRKSFKFALYCACVCLLAAGSAFANPILEFDPSRATLLPAGIPTTAGWAFMTNAPITVVALDAFDPTGTGAGPVRLYDGLGNVLASATVTTADPQEGSPVGFYAHSIAPVDLLANTQYYIAEDFAASTTAYILTPNPTVDPSINYLYEVSELGQGGKPIGDILGGLGNPGIFGPNFDIQSSALPEPAMAPAIAASVIGLSFAAIRRRKATQA